ncbi:MAG: hypothetical protein MUF83_15225 [Acidimicrobiales bacterium]|jgi:hypothetical protein|nr:hypothetical protein [Acidimicrobiales bacterium]
MTALHELAALALCDPRAADPSGRRRTDPELDRRVALSRKAAWWFFVAALVAGTVVLLVAFADYQWFFLDEWLFLSDREATSIDDLLRDHNGHWSTGPVLVYRLLFALFGLRTYLPYQLPVIASHLATVVLLRLVMRRSGVSPWIATFAALPLLLFGSGQENILWGFQIALAGALPLGLGHALLADHDGAIDKRDWIGLALGGLALTFGAVGVVMIGVVAVSTFLRRSWKPALFHAGPLVAVYLVWRAAMEPANSLLTGLESVDVVFRFARDLFSDSYDALAGGAVLAWLVALLLVGGGVLIARTRSLRDIRAELAVPIALLLGAVAFAVLTGMSRWFGGTAGTAPGRYIYLLAAFTLVPLGVAADAILRRWPLAFPGVAVLLLAGVPSNIDAFAPALSSSPATLVGWASHPLVDQVAAGVRPDPTGHPGLTVGWLRDVRDADDLPDAEPPGRSPADRIRLGLLQSDDTAPTGCVELAGPVDLSLGKGDRVGFEVVAVEPDLPLLVPDLLIAPKEGRTDRSVGYAARDGNVLEAQTDLELTLQPTDSVTVRVCHPSLASG